MNNPEQLLYDAADRESVLRRAQILLNNSLREILGPETIEEILAIPANRSKGKLGQLVERYHFGIQNNSLAEPDFREAGIELKTTPLKQTKQGLRSKERLVLNIIDYAHENTEDFELSSFWKKNKLLLVLFYLWIQQQLPVDSVFRDITYWEFANKDLEIIKRDWLVIADKIRNNRAHELSEGDTFYLGACTKGATAATSFRRQRDSNAPEAKQRAYSFKSRYVNMMLAPELLVETEPVVKDRRELERKSFEEIVIDKFTPLYGKSVQAIVAQVGAQQLNRDAKSFYASLTKIILDVNADKQIEEFEKAEIIVRTVRLLNDDLPKESVSFPHFEFDELIRESWEDSPFKDYLESKFFFVFYQFRGNSLVLRRVKFWNMPQNDIDIAKQAWTRTRELLQTGKIVKSISTSGIRYTHFPKKSENTVAHVRPHGRDRDDMLPLPVADRLTGMRSYTKQCFWLNDQYVRDIYKKG